MSRTRYYTPAQHSAGFTLLEVLVAIMIFAIMSVVAYRGLDQVLQARERLTAITTQWRELSLLLGQLGQNFAMVTSYVPAREDGQPEPVFLAKAKPTDAEETLLSMHVMGDPAKPAPASALHRVAYRLRDGHVEFLLWPAANSGQAQPEPQVLTLAEHVEEFRLRYLGPDGNWRDDWPGDQNTTPLPWGVEVQVRLRGMAPVTRIFSLQ